METLSARQRKKRDKLIHRMRRWRVFTPAERGYRDVMTRAKWLRLEPRTSPWWRAVTRRPISRWFAQQGHQ